MIKARFRPGASASPRCLLVTLILHTPPLALFSWGSCISAHKLGTQNNRNSVTGPQAESPESRSWQDHVPCRPPRKDPSSPPPPSHSLACPLASGRITSVSVVTPWIIPVPLSTSYKEASQLATSLPSLWSFSGVSLLFHPLLARRPVILDDGSS